jgi:hypothetical protein
MVSELSGAREANSVHEKPVEQFALLRSKNFMQFFSSTACASLEV